MTNLNTAFDVAEKYLDIPKMLDAEGKEEWRMVRLQEMATQVDFYPYIFYIFLYLYINVCRLIMMKISVMCLFHGMH